MLQIIDRRLILVVFVTLSVAIGFLSGSRVPNLNEKAMMGGDAEIASLGFDVVIPIEADDSFVERVVYTTVNWLDTNKRGMAFGVVFAACLMTVLALIERKRFKNGFANAFMGAVIGAPLGVCVNCAAPIAKGLHAAGARVETTLATMISSPTMNVIVITMLIALFPWYMVVTKLALTIAFVVVGVPILSRLLFTEKEDTAPIGGLPGQENFVCEIPLGSLDSVQFKGNKLVEGWRASFVWFGQTFGKHLYYIIRTTVPLMFLAGLLGSLAIVALPWETITDGLPNFKNGKLVMLLAMAGIAIMGTFLPVPITFDIIVVAVLMAAGMPVKYAMVLLFTLGIFSIYSTQIVWSYISRRIALALFFSVAVLGVVAGVIAHYTSIWDESQQRRTMFNVLVAETNLAERPTYSVPVGVDDSRLVAKLRQTALRAEPVANISAAGVTVARIPFQPRNGASGKMFARINGDVIGIDEFSLFTLLRQLPPRYWGRGIATGDIHNDGWVDLLVAADNLAVKGISLYANQQGKGFVKQRVDVPLLNDLQVVNVSLVDINGDGWLDMFVSAYRGGSYIIFNREGRFTSENSIMLPGTGSTVAAAAAFGDVDSDGDMDIVLGNWSLGYFHNVQPGEPATSRNVLLLQDNNGGFKQKELDVYPGETLATMLTDINGDGALDLIVGNDFGVSDFYYLGDGQGNFKEILKGSGVVPHTTSSTMSIASADVNNDLIPELYMAQIAPGEGAGFAEKMLRANEICVELTDQAAFDRCVDQMTMNADVDKSRGKRDVKQCLSIADAAHREDCVILHVLWTARRKKDIKLCESLPNHFGNITAICRNIFSRHVAPSETAKKQAIPQIDMHNVFLVSNGDNSFTDRAVEMGVAVTGWSWAAKFADVDNDEWQDLYVVNGLFPRNRRESNVFFHNQNGKSFAERTDESGLMDHRATGSFSYVDFDGDGDLDIISMPVNGPVRAFVNNTAKGNSVVFELRDEIGNRFGVGSKIIIRYGSEGSRQQMREIQAGGGFLSSDAPAAHFGLGAYDSIEEVEIQWSIGASIRLKGPFEAGARYIVTRGG